MTTRNERTIAIDIVGDTTGLKTALEALENEGLAQEVVALVGGSCTPGQVLKLARDRANRQGTTVSNQIRDMYKRESMGESCGLGSKMITNKEISKPLGIPVGLLTVDEPFQWITPRLRQGDKSAFARHLEQSAIDQRISQAERQEQMTVEPEFIPVTIWLDPLDIDDVRNGDDDIGEIILDKVRAELPKQIGIEPGMIYEYSGDTSRPGSGEQYQIVEAGETEVVLRRMTTNQNGDALSTFRESRAKVMGDLSAGRAVIITEDANVVVELSTVRDDRGGGINLD